MQYRAYLWWIGVAHLLSLLLHGTILNAAGGVLTTLPHALHTATPVILTVNLAACATVDIIVLLCRILHVHEAKPKESACG